MLNCKIMKKIIIFKFNCKYQIKFIISKYSEKVLLVKNTLFSQYCPIVVGFFSFYAFFLSIQLGNFICQKCPAPVYKSNFVFTSGWVGDIVYIYYNNTFMIINVLLIKLLN